MVRTEPCGHELGTRPQQIRRRLKSEDPGYDPVEAYAQFAYASGDSEFVLPVRHLRRRHHRDNGHRTNYRGGLQIFQACDPVDAVMVGYLDTVPGSNAPGFAGAWGTYPFFPSGTVIVSGALDAWRFREDGAFSYHHCAALKVAGVPGRTASAKRAGTAASWRGRGRLRPAGSGRRG